MYSFEIRISQIDIDNQEFQESRLYKIWRVEGKKIILYGRKLNSE